MAIHIHKNTLLTVIHLMIWMKMLSDSAGSYMVSTRKLRRTSIQHFQIKLHLQRRNIRTGSIQSILVALA
jgi:hypothetical protein